MPFVKYLVDSGTGAGHKNSVCEALMRHKNRVCGPLIQVVYLGDWD